MVRYWIRLSAFLMQMCLGATYSWYAYVHPLRALTGLNQGPVQLPFSPFYFAFPATMVFTESLLSRIGPRICALIGGLLFGAGWILAGLGAFTSGSPLPASVSWPAWASGSPISFLLPPVFAGSLTTEAW